jgi:hypothetical protein
MTDGSLVSERGMGCVKLSAHKNWSGDVDTERLDETQLSFDPVRQEICFDYYDNDGVRQHERMHTGGLHWVATGQDQAVPIWSGPHTLTANGRLNGEDAGVKRHWTLSIPNLKVYSERVGTQDDGNDILTHIESVWVQPAGPRNETQIYAGSMFHSDWQANEQCVLDILVREDQSGIIQTDHHSDVSLRGKRATELGLVEGSGQSFKAIIRHKGKTTSSGKPVRGFGPVVLEVERVDEIRKE